MLIYMTYIRSLKFEQKPDYKYLRSLFEDYMKENAMEIDENQFDWHIQKEIVIQDKIKAIEEAKLREIQKKADKEQKHKKKP